MNLTYLQLRTMLAGMKLLPSDVRDEWLFGAVQKGLDNAGGGPIGLGALIGIARDLMPSDPAVRAAFETLATELWRWWSSRGGK